MTQESALQPLAVRTCKLGHSYGELEALAELDLQVPAGSAYGLLGPNGGGKSTLFRILSTLLQPTRGDAWIFGDHVATSPADVRRSIGVVFQSPALDRRLTVQENLRHHGHLYGLWGRSLGARIAATLERVELADRSETLVEELSGGLKRRVEIAKGLLHGPRLLLLDEPSTGLDPGARRSLWAALGNLREHEGVTVMVTTHILDEAEECDQVGLLHQGKLVATGSPESLKSAQGGDVIRIRALGDAELLSQAIAARYRIQTSVLDGEIRLSRHRGHEFLTQIVEAYPGEVASISLGRPTLEDVFLHHTGMKLGDTSADTEPLTGTQTKGRRA